jgi:hypothetical protein
LNDTVPRDEALVSALNDARTLVGLGVPVITGRLDRMGNPDGKRDSRWNSWQRTRPNLRPIDRYDGRDAMGAVAGIAYDVIDIDPRSGGQLSFARMSQELGDDGPEVYWEVSTSSGGTHLWIAPLGLGTHNGFAPGLDLAGAGHFVFIPPTVRPSKDPANGGRLVRYKAKTPLAAPNGHPSSEAIRDYITALLADKRGARKGSGRGRAELSELEQACMDAGSGEQHGALLALIDELARSHEDDEYVFFRAWKIAQQMPVFTRGSPWTEGDVRQMLHSPARRPVADATGEEKRLLDSGKPLAPQVAARVGLHSFGAVKRERTKWIWHRMLAEGDATIVDAEAGIGKSTVSDDVAARFSRGWGMPCEAEVLVPAGNVLLLAPEDRESVQRDRLAAAGADLDRIFAPDIELRETSAGRGKPKQQKAYFGGHLITFPADVETFHRWIKQWKIGLVVIDPVAAFLGEDINSSNDASVRRALAPFVVVLGEEGCAAWLIRHFNKDTKQGASARGGGSVAFGAVARTHIIGGHLPDSYGIEDGCALAAVKTNNVRRRKGVALAYKIVDSDIVADDVGGMVGKVEWVGEVQIEADVLANGEPKRRGPEATGQSAWRDLLERLFDQKDTWSVPELKAQADDAGLPWDNKVFDKVVPGMGIRKYRVGAKRGQVGGIAAFYWTTKKERLG